mgnify:CR=1 FL=1
MNLKLHPIKIDEDSPFDNDLLGRKEEIENLTLLALNINSPAVLSIDSQWGTGKTTFIKLWEQHLKSEGISSLYFNAWETDFSEDPLVSFLGEMNEGLKSLIGESTLSKDAWSKTKAAGKKIAKRGIPALIKIGTAGVIDADKIIEDELSNAIGALAGDALDDYLKQKSSIAEFHQALSDFINGSANGKPVILFVDELDRCRPTYAIALLERIKHLFNIEGLVFVLALDKTQLGHSIGAVYGDGIDSNGYLRRFIDFEYQLKRPEIKNYIDSLISALLLSDFFALRKKYEALQHDGEYLSNVFHMLASGLQLSLREIEQLLASINLAIRTAKENEYIHPALMAFLVVSKNKNKNAYQRYISESGTETELIEYLYQIVPENNRQENFECALVEGFLIAAKGDRFRNLESEHLSEHKKIVEDDKIDCSGKRYSQNVIHVVNRPVGIGQAVNLKTLAERIDLISRLKFNDDEL